MIDATFVHSITSLAQQAQKDTVTTVDGMPEDEFLVAMPNSLELRRIKHPLRVRLADHHELRAYLDRQPARPPASTEGDILIGDNAIIAYLDDERRSYATCDLRTTKEWDLLLAHDGKPLTQADFLRLLRITFRFWIHDTTLTATLRDLRFEAGTTHRAVIGHKSESIDRSIKAELGAEVKLPEEITFDAQIYEACTAKHAITAALEVLPADQRLRYILYPQHVRKAKAEALEAIRQDLPEARTYLGSPIRPGAGDATDD